MILGNNSDTIGTDPQLIESTRFLEIFILCVIIVTAVVGNISIWIAIVTTRPLRTTTNMFILGLSAADLLVSIANMPLTVLSIITREWPLSESACVAFGFINMLTLVTSVMSLCNISINRYFMVCRPSKYKSVYTRKNAIFMLIGVLSLSIVLSSPPLFGWGEYAYISALSCCFCDWEKHSSYAIFMITCCFGGPCSVMTVCNIFIYSTVRDSKRKVSARIPDVPPDINVKDNQKDESNVNQIADESKSLKRCNSENKFINNNDRLKSANTRKYHLERDQENAVVGCDASENYYPEQDEENNVGGCAESGKYYLEQGKDINAVAEYNNIKVTNNTEHDTYLHPSWSFKRSQKRVTTLNPIVGENLDTINELTSHISANGVNSVNTNDLLEKSKNSSSVSFIRRSQSIKLGKKEEYRLAMSLIVIVIVFVMCWLPFCISMLIMIFAKTPIPSEFHMFSLLLGYANSSCNQIIYGLMNKRLAAILKDLYCCWKKKSIKKPAISSS